MSPRSQWLSHLDGSEMAAGRSAPSLTTRRVPVCSQTKTRPSAATAMRRRAGDARGDPLTGEAGGQGDRSGDAAARRSLSGGAQAVQIGDQVGEVALRQPGGQSIGHQRCMVGHAFFDLRLADDLPAPFRVDERQVVCGLALDDSREDAPVGGGDNRRPIAFDNLPRRVEHRFDQQGALILAAHVGEIRPDVAPFAA